MFNKLYEYIDVLVAKGTPLHMISAELIEAGWPEQLVNQTLDVWLQSHGRQKSKSTPFNQWLKKYYTKARMATALVVFINLIVVSVSLLKPWPTKILADSAFGGLPAPGPLLEYTGTSTLILITSIMTISLFVIGALLGVARDFILLKIGYWLNFQIKEESLNHIMHLPLYHQERLSKGDYVYRQNVVTNSLSDLVLGSTSSIIESIIVIIGVLLIMLSFNISLTIMTIILIPFLFLTMKIIGPKMGKYAKELTKVASETSSRINESVDNAETVQAFTLEAKLLGRIKNLWQKGYELTKKNMLWSEVLTNTNGFLIVLATSAVMYIGGSAALRGEMTLGELLIFMVYMGYLLGPVETLVEQLTSRNQKKIEIERIYEVLSDHEGIENLRANSHMPANIKGQIDFQNVSYAYGENVIFENLNLTIPPGQKVAIIGPSGGGKSTILKLPTLFLEPDAGKVLIDGVDIQSVSLQDLRKHISWVSQTPQLFDGTIIDNLLDADVDRQIQDTEIIDAVTTANVDEFALKLPLGLASPAGENGSGLSGGQRQRISIARALIRRTPIICMDEPTAALDAKSENYIRDSLLQMIQGKTVLLVSHRKSLLALMDVVYVLDNGTLTDVNDLGGLEHYLAKLEGLEQEIIQKEIQDETLAGVNPEYLLDQYNEVVKQDEFTDLHGINDYEHGPVAPEQPQQSVPQQPEQPIQPQQTQPQAPQNTLDVTHPEDNPDDEVEIELH